MQRRNWGVIWFKEGKKFKRLGFYGLKPSESGALDFAKKLKREGIPVADIHVISANHAFQTPVKQLRPPEPGMMWCPYCLKWRHFFYRFIRHHDGSRSPTLWRCPICSISTHDAYVRRYNPVQYLVLEGKENKLPSEKMIRRRQTAGR